MFFAFCSSPAPARFLNDAFFAPPPQFRKSLRLYLGGNLGLDVRDLDAELLRAGDDVDPLPRRHVVGDPVWCLLAKEVPPTPSEGKQSRWLCCGWFRGWEDVLGGVGPGVHEEELDIVDVADDEGLVAGGHHVLGLLVGTVADLRTRGISISLPPLNDPPIAKPACPETEAGRCEARIGSGG